MLLNLVFGQFNLLGLIPHTFKYELKSLYGNRRLGFSRHDLSFVSCKLVLSITSCDLKTGSLEACI